MLEALRNNAVWLTPVLVALVYGVFNLLKKGGNYNKQKMGDVIDSVAGETSLM